MKNEMIIAVAVFVTGIIMMRLASYLSPASADGTVQLIIFFGVGGFIACVVSAIWMILATAIRAGVKD